MLPGEPLRVEEARDGWARVRTAYDYPGWLPADALGGEPDPGLARARAPRDPLEARAQPTSARRTSGAA